MKVQNQKEDASAMSVNMRNFFNLSEPAFLRDARGSEGDLQKMKTDMSYAMKEYLEATTSKLKGMAWGRYVRAKQAHDEISKRRET